MQFNQLRRLSLLTGLLFLTSLSFVNCTQSFQVDESLSTGQDIVTPTPTPNTEVLLATMKGSEMASLGPENGNSGVYDSTGAFYNLYSNGFVQKSLVVTQAGKYRIEVDAKGASCGGVNPLMDIRVESRPVKIDLSVATERQTYSAETYLSEGLQRIQVAYTNNVGCSTADDRNLHLFEVRVYFVAEMAAPTVSTTHLNYRSVIIYSSLFHSDKYDNAATLSLVNYAKTVMKVNNVSIVTHMAVNPTTNMVSMPDWMDTPGTNLANLIAYARSIGLTVSLKNHFAVYPTVADGSICQGCMHDYPGNATFFNSAKTQLSSLAAFAETNHVSLIYIGNEMGAHLTGAQYRTQWAEIIAAMRTQFSGKLSYSATSGAYSQDRDDDPESNEAPYVGFWDLLDYMGLNTYTRVTNTVTDATATDVDLVNGWYMRFDDGTVNGAGDMVAHIDKMAATFNKPVILSEVGAPSSPPGLRAPEGGGNGTTDLNVQKRYLEALTKVWSHEGSDYLHGMDFWGAIDTDIDRGSYSTSSSDNWELYLKPAATVLGNYYGSQ